MVNSSLMNHQAELMGHTHISIDQNEISIEKIFSIIVQCFGLIITGYLFGRLNIITQEQSKGISAFTSRISLPALIFISLVEINFSIVNWTFVFLIFFAKLVIFVLVAIATLVITKPSNLGLAGIYGIFCTQGNDFAFGIPILSMLYGPAQKMFIDYLYILAPIQLLILNPMGSVLLELHNLIRAKGKDKKRSALIFNLFKNLFYNPINLMTFVGIIWNLIIGNQVPEIIYFFLDTASKAFSATALFLLGFNMNGRFKQFRNTKKLLLPLTLVGIKIIVLPLINRLFVERGLKNESSESLEEYSSFSFLYGAIPTAPTPFIYALDYNLKPDIIASAMVICTVLSSPLMFVSANMVRSAYNKMDYKEDLSKFLNQLSLISFPCIVWVLFLFIVSRKYKSITHRCTMVILLAQLGMSVSNYLWSIIKDKQSDYLFTYHLQYLLSVCSIFLLRIWTAVLAITIAFLQYRGLCFVLRFSRILFIVALITTFGLFGLVILFPSYPIDEFDPNFEFGCLQAKISAALLLVTLIITVVSIVIHHRNSPHARQRSTSRYSQLSSEDQDENHDDVQNNELINSEHTNTEMLIEESDEEDDDDTTANQQPSTSLGVQVLDVEDLIEDGFKTHCDSKFNCSKKQKKACHQLVEDYRESILDAVEAEEHNSDTINLDFYNKHQIFLHVVFLLATVLSMLIALEVCISKLLVEKSTGILIELQYLDVLMNHGLGIILFIQFGLNIEPLIAAFTRRRRLKVTLPSHINYETKLLCTNFKEYYLDKCKSEILFQLNERNNEFCYVFRGQALVDWLLKENLADNRKDAEQFSRKLLEGRLIEHITNEQYFNDNTYLYKFNF